MRASLLRAVINIPGSVILFALGMPFAWAAAEPNSALPKAIVVGPFLALAATPFFLIIHLLAALSGVLTARLRIPGKPVTVIAAALFASALAGGAANASDFGNPVIARIAFVLALALPWILDPPLWWPRRGLP
jgi:hypothetical protein